MEARAHKPTGLSMASSDHQIRLQILSDLHMSRDIVQDGDLNGRVTFEL